MDNPLKIIKYLKKRGIEGFSSLKQMRIFFRKERLKGGKEGNFFRRHNNFLNTALQPGGLHSILLQLVQQRAAVDTQDFGGPGTVAPGVFQRFKNQAPLYLLQADARWKV